MITFCTLFSGSSGNAVYFATNQGALLVDCGMSGRQVLDALCAAGLDPAGLKALLITHEHSDHIAGVRVFAKKYGIPVFASQGTLLAMQPSLEGVESWVLEGPLQLAGMEVIPFATPHDSAQSLGFRIQTADGRQFALATDLGVVTPCVREHLLGAEFVELARAGAKRFLLAHLSGENNTPSLARQEAVSALSAAGYQEGTGFWLDVAPVENQEGKSIIF